MTAADDRAGLPASQAWAGENFAEDQAPAHAHTHGADTDTDVDFDFDAAWAEQRTKREPAPRIRLLGKIYELPRSMPAKIILFLRTAKSSGRKNSEEIQAHETRELLSAILGAGNVEAILAGGIDLEQLGDVLERCMAIYKRRMDRAGNLPAPAVTTGAKEPTS